MKINELKIGGTRDAICISLVFSPIITLSPLFYSQQVYYLSTIMCIFGVFGISYRILDKYRQSNLITSKIKFKSSQVNHEFNKHQDYLIGYATDTAMPISLYYEIMKRHIMIIGQSGTGKSVLITSFLFQHALKGGGFLYCDGKNDLADFLKFYSLMCEIGRQDDIYVINVDNPEMSNTYNPILYGDPDEVATRIISLIPFSETNPGADHYRSEATVALTIFIAALKMVNLAYTFIDLSILLQSGKALKELEEKLVEIDPHAEATINFRLFLSKFIRQGGTINTNLLKDTFGGVAGRIFNLGTGKFGQVTNTYGSDVRLFDIITQNKILWVMLPTLAKTETASAFGKILVSDLRTAVSWVLKLPNEQKPNPPFCAAMDEAGSYVSDNWARLFEQSRSANIFMMPAVQTDANYKKISPELLSMVEGNTWNKIYLKIGDLDTAERIVKILGMTKSVKRTIMNTESASESKQNLQVAPNANVGDGAGLSMGQQELDVEVISATQMMSLGIGECILTIGGKDIYHLQMPMVKPENSYDFRLHNTGNEAELPGICLKDNYEEYIDSTTMKKMGEEQITDEHGLDIFDTEKEKARKDKEKSQIKNRFVKFLDLIIK
jgi:hypothetical protein